MVLRVRHQGCPPKDIDLGPAHAERTPFGVMRLELDEAIERSARAGKAIGKRSA